MTDLTWDCVLDLSVPDLEKERARFVDKKNWPIFDGVRVFVSYEEEFLRTSGGGAVIEEADGIRSIVVHESLMTRDSRICRALIQHELGHYLNGDRAEGVSLWGCCKQEARADWHAVCNVGWTATLMMIGVVHWVLLCEAIDFHAHSVSYGKKMLRKNIPLPATVRGMRNLGLKVIATYPLRLFKAWFILFPILIVFVAIRFILLAALAAKRAF